jgi:hypothetical protein
MLKDMPLPKVYQVLEPGPVVLLVTSRKGRPNLMTMSWHMMVEFEPPMIACIVSSASHSVQPPCYGPLRFRVSGTGGRMLRA